MSLRTLHAASAVEQSDDFHVARLLLLLRAGGGRTGTSPVAGIMKLAKMDFLLRYPNCLARVLKATGRDDTGTAIPEHERNSIEAKMIRFRYGPWDARYRRWIGLLVARQLGTTFVTGRTVNVSLTQTGLDLADRLGRLEDFEELSRRSRLVVRTVGSLSATALKGFVYQHFPELLTMRWGEEIEI